MLARSKYRRYGYVKTWPSLVRYPPFTCDTKQIFDKLGFKRVETFSIQMLSATARIIRSTKKVKQSISIEAKNSETAHITGSCMTIVNAWCHTQIVFVS